MQKLEVKGWAGKWMKKRGRMPVMGMYTEGKNMDGGSWRDRGGVHWRHL